MVRRRHAGRRVLVAGLAGAFVLASAGMAGAAPDGARQSFHTPKIGHVWTIILENKSYERRSPG